MSESVPPPTWRFWKEAGVLTQVAVFLVIFATSWYLLKELGPLLRPLLVAVLLCYVILPLHKRLHQGRSELKTIAIMVSGSLVILTFLGILIYGSILQFEEELPRLTERSRQLAKDLKDRIDHSIPFLRPATDEAFRAEQRAEEVLRTESQTMVAAGGMILLEGLVIGLYLLFLLLEARRIQTRIEAGFSSERARIILATIERINKGISSYLRAKVVSSLLLALPVWLVLTICGVKFAPMWAVLTFACNFIPYVGSVIGCGTPIFFTFLDLPFDWQPVAVGIGLVLIHGASASLVEPMLIGKAVGLSPLVILLSLTFWGLCWGVIGMLLAVPLTVTMKIIMNNIEPTRPISLLFGDD